MEVFSIDCSVNFGVESKVYFKALGWLLSFIGAAVVPGVSLYVMSVIWRVAHRGCAAAVALHRWAGPELRQLAQDLLAPIAGEGMSWLPVSAGPAQAGGAGATDRLGVRRGKTLPDELSGIAQAQRQSTAIVASAADSVWLAQLSSLEAAVHRLEAALETRFVLQPHASEPPLEVEGGHASTSGRPAGETSAAAGPGPLVLSWGDWLFELEMAARCRGHLWHGHADSEDDLVAAAIDFFVLSSACVCFIIWVPAATAILQLFSCIRVDPRPELNPIASEFTGLWLLQDTSQRCFQGSHMRYAFGIGIPGERRPYTLLLSHSARARGYVRGRSYVRACRQVTHTRLLTWCTLPQVWFLCAPPSRSSSSIL